MIQREDFIELLSQKGYTKKDAEIIMDDFIKTVEEILVSGESVMFRGFGTFEVRTRAPRISISPSTGEQVSVKSFKSPFFSPGKLLKREVKEGLIRE